MRGGYCAGSDLGKFILDLPTGTDVNQTSFWTARVGFRNESTSTTISTRQDSGADILWYTDPIYYPVRKTGFYCVAVVPITVMDSSSVRVRIRQAETDVPYHPPYRGVVLFRNTFDGKLPASDYPKLNFYFAMFLAYAALGGAWGYLCYRYKEELLPIQYYLSSYVSLMCFGGLKHSAYARLVSSASSSSTCWQIGDITDTAMRTTGERRQRHS